VAQGEDREVIAGKFWEKDSEDLPAITNDFLFHLLPVLSFPLGDLWSSEAKEREQGGDGRKEKGNRLSSLS